MGLIARRGRLAAAAVALLATGCSANHAAPETPGTAGLHRIEEAFVSDSTRPDNIDTPAVWHAPGGGAWLLATAKSTDRLVVYDAATGGTLGSIGRRGGGPGEFRRPNGIIVLGDLAFVVERDNRRVQVLRLPDAEPIGSFGETVLRDPYGITHVEHAEGDWDIYVTDAYARLFRRALPPDDQLGERVKRFRVRLEGDTLRAELVSAFGDTSGPGVLRQVESIHADPAHDRLLIADESRVDIKVYTLDGRYTGLTFGGDYLHHEPEGIALYACGRDDGYWIVTDQSLEVSYFHVLDRRTLGRIGGFRGFVTANTDGVAITQRHIGEWTAGAFFPVHDDRGAAAFSWSSIADALNLRSCEEPLPVIPAPAGIQRHHP